MSAPCQTVQVYSRYELFLSGTFSLKNLSRISTRRLYFENILTIIFYLVTNLCTLFFVFTCLSMASRNTDHYPILLPNIKLQLYCNRLRQTSTHVTKENLSKCKIFTFHSSFFILYCPYSLKLSHMINFSIAQCYLTGPMYNIGRSKMS